MKASQLVGGAFKQENRTQLKLLKVRLCASHRIAFQQQAYFARFPWLLHLSAYYDLMLLLAGSLPPYAHEYMRQHGSVPWASFKQGHKSGPQLFTAPWLSLLPPEAKGSLYEWGRYLFSQTALCQRGSVSVDMYGEWVLDALIASKRTSAADTLAKCCAAFAYSPLSVVIDIRAALQCISLALREVHGTERGTLVLPSYVEDQLDFVCAAGCGSQLVEGCIRIGRYSHRIKYCSEKCAQTVSHAMNVFKVIDHT